MVVGGRKVAERSLLIRSPFTLSAAIWLASRVPSSPARYDVKSKPVLISVLSWSPDDVDLADRSRGRDDRVGERIAGAGDVGRDTLLVELDEVGFCAVCTRTLAGLTVSFLMLLARIWPPR